MDQTSLFTAALGLQSPWEVVDVRFSEADRRIDFEVAFEQGTRFSCPSCGAEAQPTHDTLEREWRHLNFFQFEAYIHARIPRVRCGHCSKTTQVVVPWARPQAGFTQLMEALIITLCKAMPVAQVADLMNVSGNRLWRVLEHYIPKARAQENHSQVSAIGLDETACRRGHHYISLFHDLDAGRVLFATEGRKAEVVEQFADDLEAHGGCAENIQNVCIDMSKSFIAGVESTLPWAKITFDEFHIIQMANKVVDAVRREEVQTEPLLKKSRWGYLKDASKWTVKQNQQMQTLSKMRLKTTKAWQLRETLRDIFQTVDSRDEAESLLNSWYSWARRCRVVQMKEFALTLKRHWQGILNSFDSKLSNGRVEGINSLIQAAKARARGYRTTKSLILMSYMIAGNLAHLPVSPFKPDTTSCGQVTA